MVHCPRLGHSNALGTPQGGGLSPAMYNFHTHDAPTSPDCKILTFADDTAAVLRSKATKTAVSRTNKFLLQFSEYCDQSKIAINIDKTQLLVCPYNRSIKRTQTTPVLLKGQVIPPIPSIRYLGVFFDAKLNFRAHAEHIRKKLSIATCKLWPITASNRLPFSQKRSLALAVPWVTARFGSEATTGMSRSNRLHIRRGVSMAAKRCLNKNIRFASDELYEILNVERHDSYPDSALHKMFNKLNLSKHSHMWLHTQT